MRTQRRSTTTVQREVLLVLAGAAAGTLLLWAGHATLAFRAVSLPAAFAVSALGAIGWRSAAAVRRRGGSPADPVVHVPRTATYSGAFARIGHITGLLDFVPAEARHFEYGVRPLLVELIDDRLRRHHRIDRRAQPERARQIVGEELWTLVEAEQSQSPSSRRLRGWVEEIERL
ncbi:MAG: hypothetical protein ACRDMV_11195 [Streptosporangiales bacterium]